MFVLTEKLPFSIRVLLESVVRNCDNFQVRLSDVNTVADWAKTSQKSVEIRFKPARVVLQDFTYVFYSIFLNSVILQYEHVFMSFNGLQFLHTSATLTVCNPVKF